MGEGEGGGGVDRVQLYVGGIQSKVKWANLEQRVI